MNRKEYIIIYKFSADRDPRISRMWASNFPEVLGYFMEYITTTTLKANNIEMEIISITRINE